jgi:hypothetical protein
MGHMRCSIKRIYATYSKSVSTRWSEEEAHEKRKSIDVAANTDDSAEQMLEKSISSGYHVTPSEITVLKRMEWYDGRCVVSERNQWHFLKLTRTGTQRALCDRLYVASQK